MEGMVEDDPHKVWASFLFLAVCFFLEGDHQHAVGTSTIICTPQPCPVTVTEWRLTDHAGRTGDMSA
jgi:hypothetical protein